MTTRALPAGAQAGLRRAALFVGLANLVWFTVETVVAQRIGSVAIFADSADFFEDAAVNLIVALGAGWTLAARARAGTVLAALALIPALLALSTALRQIAGGDAPAAMSLGLIAVGALIVNCGCALVLARHRTSGSLGQAAWLSARNDALANLAMILAAMATMFTSSKWPDVIVGLAIFMLNLDAAAAINKTARAEAMEARA